MTARRCFWIPDEPFNSQGYVPSIVVEDEPGHTPMAGNGELSEPWYWGTDLATARRICAQANRDDFGLTEEEAAEIVESSIVASIRADGARTRLEEKRAR